MLRQTVLDHQIIVEPAAVGGRARGTSAAPKALIFHAVPDASAPVQVLDIGFGAGELGRMIRAHPTTAHWSVDGVDGYEPNCVDPALLGQGVYRHVWHGRAEELPSEQLRRYDVICLLDVIEHLGADSARWLLRTLLTHLRDDACLFLSTPLWFYPQDAVQDGDLEEHLIGVPASSMMALAPLKYAVSPPLVGGFLLGKRSLALVDLFQPTVDRGFTMDRGELVARACGMHLQPGVLVEPRL